MFGNERFQNPLAQCCEALKRARLIDPHQAGITDHISGQNGSEATVHRYAPFPGV